MKNTIKKLVAFTLVIALVASFTNVGTAFAAVTEKSSLIDSLVEESSGVAYSCSTGQMAAMSGVATNIVKIHLKEFNDESMLGKEVKSFRIQSNDPDWLRIVSVDNGQEISGIDLLTGDDGRPSNRFNSGTDIIVKNNHPLEDAWGNVYYEGGAYIYLIANDYTGSFYNGEEDREVSVSIWSVTESVSSIYNDFTTIRIHITKPADSTEPEITTEEVTEAEVTTEEVVEVPEVITEAEVTTEEITTEEVTTEEVTTTEVATTEEITTEEATTIEDPTTEVVTTEEITEAEPVITEEYDEEDPTDTEDIYEVGDEIETLSAIYTVTDEESGELEYTEMSDDITSATISIPKTITINGKVFKVTSIGQGAFKGNKHIKKVTIGSNINEIGEYAFYGCKKLKTIVINSKSLNSSNIGSNAFKKLPTNVIVKVPKAKTKSYKKLFKKFGLSSKSKFKAI